METLEQFQQYRRILEDFTTATLAAISSDFGRLLYISSLRDVSSGAYDHAGLLALYPREAVQQALQKCHTELFERILETPLELQEKDLRLCLRHMEGDLSSSARRWRDLQAYRLLLPQGMPSYLMDLFCSNLSVLLDLLAVEGAMASPAA